MRFTNRVDAGRRLAQAPTAYAGGDVVVVGLPLAGRTVIIIDDGIATGPTARAACQQGVARRRSIAGFRLTGDVTSAGLPRTPLLRGDDVRRYCEALVAPESGIGRLVLTAVPGQSRPTGVRDAPERGR